MNAPAGGEWWRGAAVYQIYPRSFADSDGDGIGDLAGITARLDHVAGLGVDAIWLSPFFTSPMADFGYDVADYRDVDPTFGALADFDALLARAHALGLKVIIDQVYCHTSDAHAWFAESRADRTNARADWYVWAEAKRDGTPPNNWQSVFGGPAWTWDARRRQYYLHNFLKRQPQLDGHNPAVQNALLEVARFWLARGVDGFRLDAINFMMFDPALVDNPPAPPGAWPMTRPCDFQRPVNNQNHPAIVHFLERLRGVLDEYGAFAVAEVGGRDTLTEIKAYTAPARVHTGYSFAFLHAEALTPALVERALADWTDDPGDGWPSWAFSNHDAPRVVSRWPAPSADPNAYARLLLLLLACLRGNIFVYYGEELGLAQVDVGFADLRDPEAIDNWPLTLGRDGARTPMPWRADAPGLGFTAGKPWLPFGPADGTRAVDREEADAASPLAFTRRALALRRASAALRLGALRFSEVGETMLAFTREHAEEVRLCVFNLGADPAEYAPPAGSWTPLLASTPAAGWMLPPYTGVVAALADRA